MDEIVEYSTKQKLYDSKPKSIKLQDIFNIYSLIEYKLDKEKEKCKFCGNGNLSATYYIETSPKYFIIVINRKNKLGFTYDKKFELNEKEEIGIHYEYKKYELMSVIIQDWNKWSCFLKKCESEENTELIKNRKSKIEEWIKYQDDKVSNISLEASKNNNNMKEIFDSKNAKILIYKGIKSN